MPRKLIEEKAEKFDKIVELLTSIIPPCKDGKTLCNDEVVKWVRSARNVITMELPSIVSQVTQLKNKVDKLQKKFFVDACDCEH
mgnify:FL=1